MPRVKAGCVMSSGGRAVRDAVWGIDEGWLDWRVLMGQHADRMAMGISLPVALLTVDQESSGLSSRRAGGSWLVRERGHLTAKACVVTNRPYCTPQLSPSPALKLLS